MSDGPNILRRGGLYAAWSCICCAMLGSGHAVAQQRISPEIHRAADCVVKLYGPRVGREHGYGSGVLVSADGRILTALSLLVNLQGVKVVLADGRHFDATLERSDELRQLALLRIDARALPFLSPQSSSELRQGDTVVALGNWFKIADGRESISACKGILSLRTMIDAMRLAQESELHGEVLVIDALTANPGAAGGPLLDAHERFIGLVGKVVESAATNTRINFAIPGEALVEFLQSDGASVVERPPQPAVAEGETGRPYLGIKLSRLGYRQVSAYVQRVSPNSPAAKAGIQADDLILAIDGRRVGDVATFDEAVARLLPGQTVQVVVKRGPDVITLSLRVEAMK